MTQTEDHLHNPLWRFALEFYGYPGVQEWMLRSQDEFGADVCLLLWASYLQCEGVPLGQELWEVADRRLAPRRRMLKSVRRLRRRLKGWHRARRLYERLKAMEIRMEQRQLQALWGLRADDRWPSDGAGLEVAARASNLPAKEKARWAGLLEHFNVDRVIGR